MRRVSFMKKFLLALLILFCSFFIQSTTYADTEGSELFPISNSFFVYDAGNHQLGRYLGTLSFNQTGFLVAIENDALAWIGITGEFSKGLAVTGAHIQAVGCCYASFNCSGTCYIMKEFKPMKNMVFRNYDGTYVKSKGNENLTRVMLGSCNPQPNRCENISETTMTFAYPLQKYSLPADFPNYPSPGILSIAP